MSNRTEEYENSRGNSGLNSSDKFIWLMVKLAIFVIVVLIGCFWAFDATDIKPHEVGVVHKWWGGVQKDTLSNGFKWTLLGKIHKIPVGQEKLTFSEAEISRGSEDMGSGSEFSAIEVNCGDNGGQSAWIHISVLYNVKPAAAVDLWNDGIAKTYKYVVLKRAIINAVNKNARPKEALEIYSGIGFNDLQANIKTTLEGDEVSEYFDINKVTIYQIRLNPAYESEIAAKQLAKQTKLKAIEQAAAAEEKALQAKATAQVMVEEQRAIANAAKVTKVKKAEGERNSRILDAQAGMREMELEGEGIRDEKISQAKGDLKYGLAEAKVEDALKKAMYEDSAGVRRATVEITEALADKLKGMLAGVEVLSDGALEQLMKEGAFVPENLIAAIEADNAESQETSTKK